MSACDACLRRSWLVARVAGHLEFARRAHRHLPEVLALDDERLLAAVCGPDAAAVRADRGRFDAPAARMAATAAGVATRCRHGDGWPARLLGAADAPAVIHLRGDLRRLDALLDDRPVVAIVGTRRPTGYGLDVARALGRGLAVAGVPVVSGMALGIDSAAQAGALDAGGLTVAVLAGGADVPYPASKRRLYERIVAQGLVVSEHPPGFAPRRWCFPARNRIIAALADLVVVVEAAERSGSLITADLAARLGREVAAVPGRVTAAQAAGTNELLRDGALLVRDAGDVLDALLGPGARAETAAARRQLDPPLGALLDAVAAGRDPTAGGEDAERALAGLAELELRGLVRRTPAGGYEPCAG